MELLKIDVDSIQMISDWVDMWCVKRYGKESLKTEYYYNQSDDGRYLFGVKHNEEKATIEHVRELLLKILNINIRLSDEGQSRHLTFEERERLKAERQAFYDEYTLIVKRTGGEQAVKPSSSGGQAAEKFVFDDEQVESLKAIYDDEFSDKEQAPVDYDEFKVLCNYGDFSGLLKQASDGHIEISNQVCRLYYNIWHKWDKDDKEKRNKWKSQAVKTLANFKSDITWKYITSRAARIKKNNK